MAPKRQQNSKQSARKRTRRPPVRLIEERGETPDASDTEDHPPPTPDTPPTQAAPEISNQFLFERLMATDDKINRVIEHLGDRNSGSATVEAQQNTSSPASSSMPGTSRESVFTASFTQQGSTESQQPLAAGANAQALLDGAVNHVLKESNLGEAQGEHLIASYLTAGTTLDARIKTKIWDGQFIELAPLAVANDQSVDLEQAQKMKIRNIFEWLRLFGTYMAVYLEKPANQPQASSMVSYMMTILDLHRSYGGMVWLSYDKAFRQARAHILRSFNVSWQWHTVKTEILLKSLNADKDSPLPISSTGGNKKQNQPFRDGQQANTCFDFNKPEGCARKSCRFRHACTHCDKKGHPIGRCFKKNGTGGDSDSQNNSRNSANSNTSR